MGRWMPDAHGRLVRAALELYTERGFEPTTVAEIAERAGVTERTFFRYFSDKREVLFAGSAQLEAVVLAAIAAAPADASPMDVVGAAMVEAAGVLEGNRDHARRRAAAVSTTPSLQERELLKLSTLAAASAQALRERGVPDPAAALTGEAGVAVFKVGFEAWIADDERRAFAACITDALAQLRMLTGAEAHRG